VDDEPVLHDSLPTMKEQEWGRWPPGPSPWSVRLTCERKALFASVNHGHAGIFRTYME
jgi:hypothetical protein